MRLGAPFRTALFQPDVEGFSPYSLLSIITPDLIRHFEDPPRWKGMFEKK